MIRDLGLKPVRVSEAWKKRDGFVFLNSYRGVIFNKHQSLIWEYLDGNHTVKEIHQLLYDFDIQEIDAFILSCVELGFIEYIREEEWNI